MPADLSPWLDATAQAELVRSGAVSAVELVAAAIERIERSDPAVNAVYYRRFEQALDEARAVGQPSSPFAGVPTLIKGLEASAGEPHDRGAAVLRDAGIVATVDSEMTRRLREAGFIRTVRDTAAIVDSLSGAAVGASRVPPLRPGALSAASQRPPDRLRIGVLAEAPPDRPPLHPAVRNAVLDTARLLAEAGHVVEESSPRILLDPRCVQAFFDAVSVTVAQAVDGVRSQLGREVSIDEFDDVTKHWDRHGRGMSGLDLANALTWLTTLRVELARWWAGGFDLLLLPVFPTPPRHVGWPWTWPDGIVESDRVLTFTAPFNSSGQPAIAVPAMLTDDGEPVGVQLVAAYGRDDLLVQVAALLEQLRPWAHRHPAVVDL